VSVPEGYVELGLRLGRHVDGLVDAYYGPPEIARRVESEELRPPVDLVADAESLREANESAYLDAQLVGLETIARKLAGEEIPFADEVERCYGVRPRRTPEADLEATHRALDDALPGNGSLTERYQAWREGDPVPRDRLQAVLEEITEDLRGRTRSMFGLPEGESAAIDLVTDEPWSAYNYYEGGLRSRVAVNLDVPMATNFVTELMAHELYPGHQTEHAWKEQLLYREQGRLEAGILMIGAPESMIAEGIAGLGLELLVEDEDAFTAEHLARHGVEYDTEVARAVKAVSRPLKDVGSNVALMLYEDGISEEEGLEYLVHWGLMSDKRAAQSLRFVTDPIWRSYVSTYTDGYKVCRDWVDGDASRFQRLLTEPLTPADLA
jgi:hypothetical protein